jgi:hypothetical protein
MRRFIALTLLGSLATLAGHSLVSLGLHPDRSASLLVLLQGCAALVIGTSLVGTGMLGLADGYEKLTGQLALLFGRKELNGVGVVPLISDQDQLSEINQQFWRGYRRCGVGIGVFMAGLIGLTAAMVRTTPELFTAVVGCGIITLFFAAATISIGGLRRLRSAHVGVDFSARRLARLPALRPPESVRPTRRRRPARVALFSRLEPTVRAGRSQPAAPEPVPIQKK